MCKEKINREQLLEEELKQAREELELQKWGAKKVNESVKILYRDLEAVNEKLTREIAERKQAEERIRQTARRLKSANEELEAFSYSVSHDLRAPLRGINGYSNILLEEYADHLDEEGTRLLQGIIRNTATMSQLIDDLLSFSRLGRAELKRISIDLAGLAREVYDSLSSQASGRDIVFTVDSLPLVRGDRAMMRQVFQNLIGNAIKFTGYEEQASIEVGTTASEDENVYFVKDNGAGFNMKYANKLFGVFNRLHKPSEFEGTGVGLAIVQRIVQRHGGRVWAESSVGEGATFYFSLPADRD